MLPNLYLKIEASFSGQQISMHIDNDRLENEIQNQTKNIKTLNRYPLCFKRYVHVSEHVRVSERVLSENKSARDYSSSAIQQRPFHLTVSLS